MALKVKAVERLVKFDKNAAGTYRYVMQPELYTSLAQDKVIKEAALRSGVSRGVMQACWDAAGEVIKAWATEGHSVALPGLGTMRFGLRAASVEDVNKVKTSLIKTRRIIFTPAVDLKDELVATAIQITCIDRNGKEVKRVTSTDEGEVEDPENDGGDNGGDNGGSSQNGGDNDGGDGGGSNSGSQNSGSGESSETGSYRLTITKGGTGMSTVTDNRGQVINSNDNVASGSTVEIRVVPGSGMVPLATINGTNITLTEDEGNYVATFAMPTRDSELVIHSSPGDNEGD